MSARDEGTGRQVRLPVVQGDGGSGGAAGMDRRHALKIMALAAAAPATFSACGDPADDLPADGVVGAAGQPASNPRARGDAWDPDLLNPTIPWERVLTDDELQTLARLCDTILPADDRSPAASALGCHDFIDEWVSAPYGGQERDLVLVRGGLVWLDQEAARRYGTGRRFRDLAETEVQAVCDDICYAADAAPGHRAAARFFDRVRDLTASAYYTTEEGMADIGYVGNVPLTTWELPPPEVLRHLGLEGEV